MFLIFQLNSFYSEFIPIIKFFLFQIYSSYYQILFIPNVFLLIWILLIPHLHNLNIFILFGKMLSFFPNFSYFEFSDWENISPDSENVSAQSEYISLNSEYIPFIPKQILLILHIWGPWLFWLPGWKCCAGNQSIPWIW